MNQNKRVKSEQYGTMQVLTHIISYGYMRRQYEKSNGIYIILDGNGHDREYVIAESVCPDLMHLPVYSDRI